MSSQKVSFLHQWVAENEVNVTHWNTPQSSECWAALMASHIWDFGKEVQGTVRHCWQYNIKIPFCLGGGVRDSPCTTVVLAPCWTLLYSPDVLGRHFPALHFLVTRTQAGSIIETWEFGPFLFFFMSFGKWGRREVRIKERTNNTSWSSLYIFLLGFVHFLINNWFWNISEIQRVNTVVFPIFLRGSFSAPEWGCVKITIVRGVLKSYRSW